MSRTDHEADEADEADAGDDTPITEVVWLVRSPETGKLGLACIAKRTYALRSGRLALADEQVSLVAEPDLELDQNGKYRTLLDDSDLYAPKQATDVVVLGSIHARSRVKEVHAAVAVGSFARRLRAVGERHAEVRPDGSVRFSEPDTFERVALLYDNAYGGYDAYAHDALDPPPKYDPPPNLPSHPFGPALTTSAPEPRAAGSFAYPRNGAGVGYFIDVDRPRADGARLPQIEDPSDLLTPARLFVPAPKRWIDAPIPGSFGWVHHAWYPRSFRLVGPLVRYAEPARPIREVSLGDGDDLNDPRPPSPGTINPRAIQGAAPGLARGRLRGDEPIVLQNLHREMGELRCELPGEAPRFTVRPPDIKAFTPRPVLQTVRIEPDHGRVSLVWCGVVPIFKEPDESFLDRTELTVAWARL